MAVPRTAAEPRTMADDREEGRMPTPTDDRPPAPRPIEPSAPENFGRVQVWWGDGKGKTTAALGMAFRAAGHGFRVHLLQFMKGGSASVEDVRGEYNAIALVPGFTYEHAGHYGWHGPLDGSDDEQHREAARAGLDRARELVEAASAASLDGALAPGRPPVDGVHLLVLDEILYAAERSLIGTRDVVDLIESKPDRLELVLTGGHREPAYLREQADLITRVQKEKHPFDSGVGARKGTEY